MKFNDINLLKQILIKAPDYIFWKDIDLVYRGCNLNFAKAAGFDAVNDVIGKTDKDMKWGKYTGPIYTEEDNDIIKTREPILSKEVPMRTDEEHEQLLSVSKVPLYDNNNDIIGILGIYIDITKHKEIEALRIENEVNKERAEIMTLMAGAIAHELRTPLTAVKSTTVGIQNALPKLLTAYQTARDNNLEIPLIPNDQLIRIKRSFDNLQKKIEEANTVIDILLSNLSGHNIDIENLKILQISSCIQGALSQYTFSNNNENKIIWDQSVDFKFNGDDTLIIHVILNLLKNAFYFIDKVGKGEIYIWAEINKNKSLLHFKDTAQGIEPEVLPKIFNQFFTYETNRGTGIGLSFCKIAMQSHHGNIECYSKFGEFTEFVLSFPKI